MEDGQRAVRARVTGRVQGVWFRAWTRQRAEALGLAGWVRNDADGAVTALIVGPAPAVDAMIEALREGPPAARVSNVSFEETELTAPPTGFSVTD